MTFLGALPRQGDVVQSVGKQQIDIISVSRFHEDAMTRLAEFGFNPIRRGFDVLPQPLQMSVVVAVNQQAVEQPLHMAGAVDSGEHFQFRQRGNPVKACRNEAGSQTCRQRLGKGADRNNVVQLVERRQPIARRNRQVDKRIIFDHDQTMPVSRGQNGVRDRGRGRTASRIVTERLREKSLGRSDASFATKSSTLGPSGARVTPSILT